MQQVPTMLCRGVPGTHALGLVVQQLLGVVTGDTVIP